MLRNRKKSAKVRLQGTGVHRLTRPPKDRERKKSKKKKRKTSSPDSHLTLADCKGAVAQYPFRPQYGKKFSEKGKRREF